MKRKLISTLLLLGLEAQALPVDTTSLKEISVGFLGQTLQIQANAAVMDTLSSAPPINIPAIERTVQIAPNLYTVYFVGGGFVTLSMDDLARPILAYSLNGTMPDSSFNEAYDSLIRGYSGAIDSAKILGISDPQIEAMWDDLQRFISGNQVQSTFADTLVQNTGLLFADGATGPLLQTKWNQGAGWNMFAPSASGGPGGKAYAGCVATAMGQIMKYWSFPTSGVGSRNNINFALAQYAWDSMPATSYTPALATLLRHAGASVDMNYGGAGSGAYTYKSAIAYKDYFRYKPTAAYVQKQAMSAQKWLDTLKKEIDAGRPVQYEGFGTGGHAFVMDGYNSSDYLHFNFGWSGYGDGWYALSAITPGTMSFTNSQGAIIGIQPGNYTKAPGQSVTGLRSSGQAYASGDLASLSKLDEGASYSTINAAISKFSMADLNHDHSSNDVLGMSPKGVLMFAKNFGNSNSWTSLPGVYKTFVTYDQEGTGYEDAIAAITSTGYISTKSLNGVFRPTTSRAVQLYSADLNGSGYNTSIISMDAAYALFSSTDSGINWTKINTGTISPRSVIPFDTDSNLSRESLALIDANRYMWSNRSGSWVKIGSGIASAVAADLDQDGSADDFIGLSPTGVIALSNPNDTTWQKSTLTGFRQAIIGDADGDGVEDDIIAINSSSTITVFLNKDLSKSFKAPISAAQISMSDLDGNGTRESLIARASNGSFNVSSQLSQVWLGNALDLETGTFDDIGTQNDLMGIAYDGTLFRSLNGHDWSRIYPPVPAVDLSIGDFNRDGIDGEMAIAGANGKIYYSANGNTWDSLSTPGMYKVGIGDFDADGYNDDLLGVTKTLNVYVSKDLDTFLIAGSSQKSAFAIDLDGDGKKDDIAGISSTNTVKYTTDLKTWTAIPSTYVYASGGDFDADGKFDDIVALSSAGIASYTTNLTSWTLANGKGYKSVVATDLDGQGSLNDLIALDGTGNLWYSKDRYSWTQIPGLFKYYAVGNFSSLLDVNGILQSQQTLASLDSAAQQNTGSGNTGSGNTKTESPLGISAQWLNHSLILQGMHDGTVHLILQNSKGQNVMNSSAQSSGGLCKFQANLTGMYYGIALDSKGVYHSFQILAQH